MQREETEQPQRPVSPQVREVLPMQPAQPPITVVNVAPPRITLTTPIVVQPAYDDEEQRNTEPIRAIAPPALPVSQPAPFAATPPPAVAAREPEASYAYIPPELRKSWPAAQAPEAKRSPEPETTKASSKPERQRDAPPILSPNLTGAKKAAPNLSSKKGEETPVFTQPSKKADENDDVPWAAWTNRGNRAAYDGIRGRERTFADVIDLLSDVYDNKGEWPDDVNVSAAMRRYYRREYPEFFAERSESGAARIRAEKSRKAAILRAQHRPSRAKIKKGVHAQGSAPIDLQAKRRANG